MRSKTSNRSEDIAVIGMAGRFPGANDVATFWRNLAAGVESTRELSDAELVAAGVDASLRQHPDYVRRIVPLDDVDQFDADFFGFNAREASMTAPSQRLLLLCAYEALEDAGYSPAAYAGNIGVFVGANRCDEWQRRLYVLAEQMAGQTAKLLPFSIATDLDYSATRISYKLNLNGPSLSINTACSTSLVAIIQASRALAARECELALAGGSNVVLPLDAGYVHEQGGIRSNDGHCRAFDARANGTNFGSGAGVVVLKRLRDARADRDHIYAVIRGGAINNDGSAKVGFTAPSVTGQSQVIAAALASTGVHPDEIGYIEAHGTGTALGDPIEIEALTKAYRAKTKRKRYCAIGSVKTNIGHLGQAAGVAGLIKTAQALLHRQIPPSLNFERPNPEIDFAGSPFFVNTELKPWQANGIPRRAAISSFGVGGTNAHLILEEPPPAPTSGPRRAQQLIVLSAKSATALTAASRRLADRLAAEPTIDLADVAYTLSTGRGAYPQRRACVAATVEEAIAALRADADAITAGGGDAPVPVAFMFPGQGAQHVGMGHGLYRHERIFQDTVDDCAQRLAPWIGRDIRELLWPEAAGAVPAEDALRQTDIAQPALFVFSYALARLWQSWGVRPDRMIGHSVGEYVAACLAGVFNLDDALRAVAERGRLMQSMPAGAMLAVSLGEAALQPLLGDCELAAVNGPQWCVASGADTAIRDLEQRLNGRDLSCRRLHTSHAFHSRMMEPMLREYARVLRAMTLRPPQLPFLSNLTGDWIKHHEATDPAYWVKQLRSTVQFYAGARRLLDAGHGILLEVGPGQTLATLVKALQTPGEPGVVVAACRQPKHVQDDQAALLHAVGRLWSAGVPIDWSGFYAGEQRARLSLPTYPFEGRRYWLERRDVPVRAPAVTPGVDTSTPNPSPDPNLNSSAPANPPSFGARLHAATVDQRQSMLRSFVRQRVELLLGTTDLPDDVTLIELGMSSLSAIELRTQINTTLGEDRVSVVTLLDENATIDNLVAMLSEAIATAPGAAASAPASTIVPSAPADTTPDAAPIDFPVPAATLRPDPENQYRPFPLTDIQQAYWVGRHRGGGDDVATYGYFETDVHGLDVARYEKALNALIQRHHMLRMVVQPDGNAQFLRDVPYYTVAYQDLTPDTEDARRQKLEHVRATLSHQALDPGRWPLFQICIHRIDADLYRIHLGFDFLIVDVLSMLVFLRDQFLIYANVPERLVPLAINFRDYVLAEKASKDTELYQRAKRYWLDRVPTLPPAPMLPYTQEAAQIRSPRYAHREFALDADTWGRLKEGARRIRVTPSVLIATAYAEVLAQWSKSARFTINLTVFNRPRLHPQMNDLIGDFTSSVLLESDLSQRMSFEQRAKCVQAQLMKDLEHRQFTGVEMLRAMNSQQGGYQAVVMPVVLTSALGLDQYADAYLAGLDAERLRVYREMTHVVYAVSQTSQVWLDHVVRERDGMLLCNWDALEALFPERVLDDMFCAYYDRLIALANEDEEAWRRVHVAPLPAPQQARRDLVNRTDAPVSDQLLQQAFEQAARAHPERVAVINGGTRLTYRVLHVASTRLGKELRDQGARPNRLVAVVMHKGWEQIVAVFATLYAGAAYMPVDAALPPERIAQLLRQGEVDLALTQTNVIDVVSWPPDVRPVIIDTARLEHDCRADAMPVELPATQTAKDLAYVLFTSGSTGTPKGVMIDHESALNTVLDVNRRFGITEHDRAIAINALNFDLSVYDVFGLLSAGGALVMPEHARALDPNHWAELVVAEGVTFWNTVPAIVQLYVEALETKGDGVPPAENRLRWVFMSGDWIPVGLPDRIRRVMPHAQPVSLGGPTETTVWSVHYPIDKVEADWKSIPYGKPLANRSHRVLHADLSDCPEWVPGEIYTGGRIGLSRGYWADEEKTSAAFLCHPDTGERLYRTGDWGRFLPDGNIEFLGREDRQVKVQGHRIELGEIEHALRQCEDVDDAVVLALRDPASGVAASNTRLVAYVVEQDAAQDAAALKELKAGGTLTDPLDIAAFKLKQIGRRRLDAALPRVALPHAPDRGQPLPLHAPGVEREPPKASPVPIPFEQWGRWLSGLGQLRLEGHTLPKYYYPSAGSTYSIQTYLYIQPDTVQSLDAGIYYYDPEPHALVRLGADTAAPPPDGLRAGEFVLWMVCDTRAITPVYGQIPAERFYKIEAGHIEQLLRATGVAQRIGLRPAIGIPESLTQALTLDAEHRLVRCLVGGTVAPAAATPDMPPLDGIARQSYRRFAQRPVARERLAALLDGGRPILAGYPGVEAWPEIYLYIKPGRVVDLAGGLYRYDAGAARLVALAHIDAGLDNLQYTRNRRIHRGSAFSLMFAAPPPTVGDTDTSLWAAGFLAQALINSATQFEIGLCSTGGIKTELIRPYLPAGQEVEVLYCLEGGTIDMEQTQRWVTESMHGDVAQQWREALRERLPYYMVPGTFVRLPKFPLTPNAKVDRRALAAMAQTTSAAERTHVAARDAIEAALVGVWQNVLQLDRVGVDDNLFEIGGDSLTATKLVAEAGKTLGVNVPLHQLFAQPTIAGMAGVIREASVERSAPAAPSDDVTAILLADAELSPEIRPQGTAAPEIRAPQNILLTGVTGFLGAYVLRELLETTTADVYCLVRPRAAAAADQRIAENLKRYGLWKQRYLDRVTVVNGDLAADELIADAKSYEYLCANIDVIYHVGAHVNFARAYHDVKKANVGGAAAIIRFACRERLKAINFVSTKYLCFSLGAGGLRVHRAETPVTDPTGLIGGYTQSKWVAERLFEQAGARGVPVAILRVGQITGAMHGKAVVPGDAFHHLLRLFRAVGSRPGRDEWREGAVDIVPVDYVARAIVAIGGDPACYGKYYHVVNPQPLPMDRLFAVLRDQYAEVSFTQWVEACRVHTSHLDDAAVAFLLKNFFEQTAHGPPIRGFFAHGDFATANVTEALAARIACPAVADLPWRRYREALKRVVPDRRSVATEIE